MLCPSFYTAHKVHNPGSGERWITRWRRGVVGWLQASVKNEVKDAESVLTDAIKREEYWKAQVKASTLTPIG